MKQNISVTDWSLQNIFLKKNWLIHSFGSSVIQPWFFFSLTNCTIIQFYKALAIHEPSSSACKNSNQNNKYKWYSLIPVIFSPRGLFLICLSLHCSLFKRFFTQKLCLVPEDFLCHHDTIISVVSSIYHRATKVGIFTKLFAVPQTP